MPGVPGNMLDDNAFDQDVFHASVILGCTIITSDQSSLVPLPLTCSSGSLDSPQIFNSLQDNTLFHPPIATS
jgi:hypothetical protein